MLSKRLALSLIFLSLLGIDFVLGCGKNLTQIFFHPSVDARFADSQLLPAPTPVAVNPNQFHFAMFGDPQMPSDYSSILTNFTSDVAPNQIDFFVVAGDLTEDATNDEFSHVKTALDAVGIPYYATIGNHDLFQIAPSGGWETWKSTFGPATYSVTVASQVRFIFLDTATGDIGDSQFAWLQSQLSTSVPFTFVCSHYPVYDGSTPWIYRLSSYEERYRLASMLNQFGVYAYVSGHLHALNHTQLGTVEHFIVGGMYPNHLDVGNHGYVLFSYDNGALSWNWMGL